MMKKVLILVCFSYLTVYSQQIKVVEEVKITNLEDGMFFYPGISPDGEQVLYTSGDYKGLWLHQLNDGSTIKLNDADGAGYEPQFAKSGEEIIYRTNKFINGKRYSSLFVQNIESKQIKNLEKDVRNLYPPKSVKTNSNVYLKNSELKSYSPSGKLAKSAVESPVAYIENSNIVLHIDGEKRILAPLGKGNYIWPSVSPDGQKLLFNLAGKGTFVSDLDGNILADLGYANYPSWSRNGKWIVFMEDYDDGYVITSSEIGVVSADGTSRFQLTETSDRIELYPKWSPATDEIVFHTDQGEIYKLTLMVN
jgi:Tol biopolymer transport system component